MSTALLLLTGAPASAIPPFDDCKSPPVPSDSLSSVYNVLDGSVDTIPLESSNASPEEKQKHLIGHYGYAGTEWSTYNLGCGGAVRDPGAATDTMIGNALLGTSKFIFAASQGLANMTRNNDITGGVVTDASDRASSAVYEAVFSPWAGAALVVAAAVIMVAAGKSDIGTVLTRAGLILVAITIAALSFGPGAQLSRDLTGALKGAINDAQQRIAENLYPAATAADPQDSLRDAVYYQIIYGTWQNGEVGSTGRPEIAWDLLQNQAISLDEAGALAYNEIPGGEEELFAQKGEQWMDVADNQAGQREMLNIQGRGESRALIGLYGLVMTLPIALMQLFGSLVQIMMYFFLAFLPVAAPLVGLLGIVKPDTPEKSVRVVGAVIFGGIVASVCTVVHTAVIMLMAEQSNLGDPIMLVISWVSTIVLLGLLRPLVSLAGIVGSTRMMVGRVGGGAGKIVRAVRTEARYQETAQTNRRRHREVVGALRGSQRGAAATEDGGTDGDGGGPAGGGG
ncbi:MAG: hypothetical protein L0I76_17530, partial [Pseudonocardia sp.]|nr:hypothetical protein [Pseudonocardia sp.]